MTRRICAQPGCPTITTQRRCPTHATQYERDRGTPAERGYGTDHKRLRRELASDVAAGRATCWRCRQPITPNTPWDLGHTDDRTTHAGPEHTHCNRSAGGKTAHNT